MKLCPKCQKHFSDDANFCPVDAARLLPLEGQTGGADALTAKFELGQKLGGSRTGAVHKAVDKATGKPCVVKIISREVVALPGVAQRLERELKQLERVKSVGVCHVLGSGKRGDETWVATELLDGAQTLAEAIGARGPLPQDQAADLIELIGEALIEAAQVGVVHRDLAPKNILFAGQDIKLINFSLPVPTTDKIPGVPEFVAPEQVEGRPVDQRSNLYSLGALYYYVLTGQTPHAGSAPEVHQLHVNGSIKPPSTVLPVPQPIEAVIMRALDRSPTKRFLTVRQFVDEVQRVGHSEVIELKATMAMGKAGRPKGDLVQTLLGVKGSFPGGVPGSLPAISSAPTVNPQPAVAPAPITPAAVLAHVPSTEIGFSASQPTTQSGPPQMPPPVGPSPAAPLTPPQDAARSPWSPPAAVSPPVVAAPVVAAPVPAPVVAAPVVAAPVVAAPVVAAPVVAAPVLAAPVVAAPQAASSGSAAPAGKKKAAVVEDRGDKGKFRETMWFKKGELDAQAAVAAAEERQRSGKEVADKADSKAIDERYNDDGSITRGDKEKYSLRTGATEMNMPALRDKASQSLAKVSEDELIGEMKGLPKWIIFAILGGVLAIGAVVVAIVA